MTNKTKIDRRFLVILRAGDKSLHPLWMTDKRNWDLVISSYGDNLVLRSDDCLFVDYVKGPKWQPVYDIIKKNQSLINQYKYVLIPDDDLLFSGVKLSKFFEYCELMDFAVAQPSLSYKSFVGHLVTISRPFLSHRETNFVEVMTPCFRVDILKELIETFTYSKSGWGLDLLWWSTVSSTRNKFAIVDSITVEHTRPVGGGNLYAGNNLKQVPQSELAEIMARAEALHHVNEIKTFVHYSRWPMIKISGLLVKINEKLTIKCFNIGQSVRDRIFLKKTAARIFGFLGTRSS